MPPKGSTQALDPLAFGKIFLTSNPEIGLLLADRVAHNPEIAVLSAMEVVYRTHLILHNPDRVLDLVTDAGKNMSPNDRKVRENVLLQAAEKVKEMKRLYEIATATVDEPVLEGAAS